MKKVKTITQQNTNNCTQKHVKMPNPNKKLKF